MCIYFYVCGCFACVSSWEWNIGPLREQPVLLITEFPFQTPNLVTTIFKTLMREASTLLCAHILWFLAPHTSVPLVFSCTRSKDESWLDPLSQTQLAPSSYTCTHKEHCATKARGEVRWVLCLLGVPWTWLQIFLFIFGF